MIRKVKVALGQMTSKLGDVEYNVKKAVEFIRQAAHMDADIICLPELFATGYNLRVLKDEIKRLSCEYSQFIIKELSKSAKDNNIYVIAPFGIVEKTENNLYNAAVVFDSNGNNIGNYYKTHAFSLEKEYFVEGNQYNIFETNFGRIGILICYDVGFPEAARTLCLKGAEIIFIPAAWRIQDENAWLLNVPSRALENQLYTIGVNRSGFDEDVHLFGKSMVCNPDGKVEMQIEYDMDGVVVWEIDLNEVERCRSDGGYLADRKPEIYEI